MGIFSWAVGEMLGTNQRSERFQVRAVSEVESGPESYQIQIKGSLPVYSSTDLWCAINFFDVEENLPIISLLDVTKEENSRVFLHSVNIGIVGPDQFYPDWVNIGPLANEIILPPRTGKRNLEVNAYLYSAIKPLNFNRGYLDDKNNCIAYSKSSFQIDYRERGYMDESEDSDTAKVLTIGIAMKMAMADGSLDPDEGIVIKKWISNALDDYNNQSKRERMKKRFNMYLESSYKSIQSNHNSQDSVIGFNKVATKADKFAALELCLDVMAADGVAEKGELSLLTELATTMGIDYSEISNLKDKRIMNLDTSAENSGDQESIIGLDKSLSNSDKKKFIRKEFMKWNGRLHSLKTEKEKENAQKMLIILGDLRKKYESY